MSNRSLNRGWALHDLRMRGLGRLPTEYLASLGLASAGSPAAGGLPLGGWGAVLGRRSGAEVAGRASGSG